MAPTRSVGPEPHQRRIDRFLVGLASLDPIRTNLSDGILQKFWVFKELE
jgi:hypothetical protein